ncbi:protein O-linked-mannose beta-1,4-N-acetylglucosaminyltransferase 2-like [Mizuhopecten yessoensis]|uniref:Glycosyltransferase-like domain-containing protein 2 n=1 Tax=Mizuhopecten yessoensis TaxID=6573 RepID=A0A210QQ62_MIZYE|nr:protein O-linked-mannose beta-1,4-N-acetylglucosaminyltransferase 2-like [Mizuhopecten yessoensis]XP_021352782.1 protein O-linked-mannose beta-1,4-N-acetylglucosaminyltransferase 2-like [Mizuhopecten yessoensis]OWF50877.1 Glycosyltransferase-like domain-containing protein 2 [Mizuhopecten yessoensis]
MTNLHFITHAVMLSVMAVVVKKYMDLRSHVEDLQMDCYPHPFLSQPPSKPPPHFPYPGDNVGVNDKVKDFNYIATSQSDFQESDSNQDIDNLGATKYDGKGASSQQNKFSGTDFSSHSDQNFGTDFIQSSQASYSSEAQSGRYFEEYEKTKAAGAESSSVLTLSSKSLTEGATISTTSQTDIDGSEHVAVTGKAHESKKSKEEADTSHIETSVWCHGNSEMNKICHFQNLCYSPLNEAFLFYHSDRSVLDRSQLGNDSKPMLRLSTVYEYNGYTPNLIDLKSSAFDHSRVKWVKGQSVIFSRFKPDNIMHVLHDDIFPLHFTLNFITGQNSLDQYDVQIVFMEGWDRGDFADLYSSFTTKSPIYINDLSEEQLVCFEDAYAGLSTAPVWYQYGYIQSQAPVKDTEASGFLIHNTVNFIVNQLDMQKPPNMMLTPGDYFVLFSRKDNRRIVNEMELMLSVSAETNLKVFTLSLETHSLKDIMHYVRFSRGIVGMHGSLMSLAAFLRPGAFVIELFPYAVSPKKYPPFRTLAELPGMNLVYTAWQNLDKTKSIGHPDWPADIGGIGHLPPQDQAAIMAETEVQDHLCCSDPSWLYHIYQDTEVDIPAITRLIKAAMNKPYTSDHQQMFPAKVSKVRCDKLNPNTNVTDKNVKQLGNVKKGLVVLKIQWASPQNLDNLDFRSLHYEVRVVQEGVDDILFIVTDTSLLVSVSSTGPTVKVWVKAVINNKTGGLHGHTLCLLTEHQGPK